MALKHFIPFIILSFLSILFLAGTIVVVLEKDNSIDVYGNEGIEVYLPPQSNEIILEGN